VKSEDLAEALENGTIWGAGLDVITGEPGLVGPSVGESEELYVACFTLRHFGLSRNGF